LTAIDRRAIFERLLTENLVEEEGVLMPRFMLSVLFVAGLATCGLLVGGAAASSAPSLTHMGVVQTVHRLGSTGAHPNGVIYSQNDNDTGIAVLSQSFEPDFAIYDSQLADDFVVPDNGHPWQIQGISVTGQYFNGSGPADSETVTFYQDAGGVPGAVVNTQTVVGADSGGSFTIPLAKFALPQGHYWVSVVANMAFSSGGEWGWEVRSVQNGTGAVWQNPGGGFGTGCTTWTTVQTCVGFGPDLMFSLSGAVLGKP
jgi:hypothetical protein